MDFIIFPNCTNCICVPVCKYKIREKLVSDCALLFAFSTRARDNMDNNSTVCIILEALKLQYYITDVKVTEDSGYYDISELEDYNYAYMHGR